MRIEDVDRAKKFADKININTKASILIVLNEKGDVSCERTADWAQISIMVGLLQHLIHSDLTALGKPMMMVRGPNEDC